MKFLSRKQPASNERRRVPTEGRAPVFSYHTYRSQEPGVVGRQIFRETINAKTASRAARYSVQRFGLLIVLLVALVSLVNILRLTPDPKLVPLDSGQGLFLHSMSTYQVAAGRLFSSSILNSNKITVDTASVSVELKRQFPELEIVSIKLPLTGHRPIIYVAPAQPLIVLTTTSGKAYVVDERGRALSAVGAATAERLHLVNAKDESGASIRIGELALSSDTAAFMHMLLFQLAQKDVAISTFVMPAGKSELDMYLSGQAYFVKFTLVGGGTSQEQIGTFLAVRHYLQEKGMVPSQYIDVRVEGRAYYK